MIEVERCLRRTGAVSAGRLLRVLNRLAVQAATARTISGLKVATMAASALQIIENAAVE